MNFAGAPQDCAPKFWRDWIFSSAAGLSALAALPRNRANTPKNFRRSAPFCAIFGAAPKRRTLFQPCSRRVLSSVLESKSTAYRAELVCALGRTLHNLWPLSHLSKILLVHPCEVNKDTSRHSTSRDTAAVVWCIPLCVLSPGLGNATPPS